MAAAETTPPTQALAGRRQRPPAPAATMMRVAAAMALAAMERAKVVVATPLAVVETVVVKLQTLVPMAPAEAGTYPRTPATAGCIARHRIRG